ncbi:hypothetical protein BCR43DRAFT_450211 [Syncephalastrum racemosum]|uniref:HECT-type E3 ubiquitin transferase n=1 Tax=Syncephalastrum racemosum TaxID=13706 RepID=A0A1X2HU23_SYNRA|nr:hypothetical protein BCR43DRAFT_450211 [Syncephalastrum racemosum]
MELSSTQNNNNNHQSTRCSPSPGSRAPNLTYTSASPSSTTDTTDINTSRATISADSTETPGAKRYSLRRRNLDPSAQQQSEAGASTGAQKLKRTPQRNRSTPITTRKRKQSSEPTTSKRQRSASATTKTSAKTKAKSKTTTKATKVNPSRTAAKITSQSRGKPKKTCPRRMDQPDTDKTRPSAFADTSSTTTPEQTTTTATTKGGSKPKSRQQDPMSAKADDRSTSSKKKGKGKAIKPSDSAATDLTRDRKFPSRRLKKQADPEDLPDNEYLSSHLSYADHFNDDDEEDDNENEDADIDEDTLPEGRLDFDDEDEDEDERYEHAEDWAQDDYGEEDEDEDEDEDGLHDDIDEAEEELERVRQHLGLQMQSTFGGMMSDMKARLRTILTSLQNDDPTMQLIALQELAEILSVSNEDNLQGIFHSEVFIKELVRIMKGPADLFAGGAGGDMADDMMLALAMSEGLSGGNPELTLLACRCISNLVDAMPTSVTHIVYHGAIGVLCQKLKSIEYIDLAEQALSALEKVASQLPRQVVQEGGLSATLMYFDFFSIHSQRTALRTASNCLRGVDVDSFPQVLEATPTLLNTTLYPDRTVVELTCLCWVRIAEAYRNNREQLEKVISVEVLQKLMTLIPVPGNTSAVRQSTFQDIVRTFHVVARGSSTLATELLQLNVVDHLYRVLTGAALPSDAQIESAKYSHISLDNKFRDMVNHIVRVVVDVLPSLPKGDMFSMRRFREVNPAAGRPPGARAQVDASRDKRVELLETNKKLLQRMDYLLIPVLIEVYSSTVAFRVRQLVTHSLVKLVHFSDAETLQKVLKDVPLSSFLAGVLAQREYAHLVTDALFVSEMLLKKLPEVYHFLFKREGVMHEVETIASMPASEETETRPSDANETGDASQETIESMASGTGSSHRDEQSATEKSEDEDDRTKASGSSDTELSSSPRRNGGGADQSPSSAIRRRLLERSELHALLRSRFALGQPHRSAPEEGIGRGNTRQHIVQLAKTIARSYQQQSLEYAHEHGSQLVEVKKFAESLKAYRENAYTAEQDLIGLRDYLQASDMGISSFELMNSGLLDALVTYLTEDDEGDTTIPSLEVRRALFRREFMQQVKPDHDVSKTSPAHILVLRLQELLSRFESFEVVTPLESSSLGDHFRNPTSMLAKQLRLRLSGEGDLIPREYSQLMVSTHAVATFKVLEEYLLTKIGDYTGSSTERATEDTDSDDDSEGDEEDDQEQANSQNRDMMDVDDEEAKASQEDTEMQTEEAEGTSRSQEESTKDAIGKGPGDWHIQFSLNGTPIANDTTVYGAVHQYEMRTNQQRSPAHNIWIMSYPVTYKRVWIPKDSSTSDNARRSTRQLDNLQRPSSLESASVCSRVLDLLSALAKICDIGDPNCPIPAADFMNRKLAAKMNRQLEEPLIVASSCLPDWTYWVMREAPFLFPFETRYLFIQSTSFGYSRLIAHWQSLQMRNTNQRDEHQGQSQQPLLGRMERQKVRIARSEMLESAVKVLNLFGKSQSVLEIEYQDEEGTGLGPTLEFYAATSKEFCRKSLNMWRNDNADPNSPYVSTTFGLFPRPMANQATKSNAKIIKLFRSLGQFLAKAMLDFRIVDIPFNPAFFKVVLDHDTPDHALVMQIDPVLGASIAKLQAYADKKREIYDRTDMSGEEKTSAIKQIEVNGIKIDDLCLDFTLPGQPEIELKKFGSDIPVTIQNVEEYIDRLIDMIAGSGIEQQINAFREGFNELFAIDDLKILTYTELVALFGVSVEDWTYEHLADTIKADHGYNMESRSIKHLLTILSQMTEQERREFLQFTTGSPRLPIGGWKAMRPIFTVVCKTSEAPLSADDYLPSVMTCANYLKMPDYSTMEVMKERLLTSMREGKNSFLLS